jgi:UDP-N-acetylmuramyl tripeptide synthase
LKTQDDAMHPEPFQDSRRLTGCNVYFAGTGAALESAEGVAFDDIAPKRWRGLVRQMRRALGWPDDAVHQRVHASGVTLAFAAPLDQLYTATEVNEWAWWQASGSAAERFHAPGFAAVWDAESALRTLRAVAAAEAIPQLAALQAEADAHDLPFLLDEDELTLGSGTGARSWFLDELPQVDEVPWARLHGIPTALVTGSNGKTTTVRLLAALCRAHGWPTAYSSTDGVRFDDVELETGDFSGPGGARTALRQGQAQAAVLETARGGMLRRGLATCRANVAVVTNVAADHFGEYGVHGLDDLAAVKLTVARAIGVGGRLVLNADDALLRAQAGALSCPLAWHSQDFQHPLLVAQRAAGQPACGVRDGHLWLSLAGVDHDLGATVTMPLSLGNRAGYNIENLAGAALAASALGIAVDTIAAVLARFGNAPQDNPGRLQHWAFGDVHVYLDYAHNPDGLRGLLDAVGAGEREGRLAIVLGHAGNREDADLCAVAATAAAYRPELIVLKDIAGYERGRASGEVAGIMRNQLLADGIAPATIAMRLDEVEAARAPLTWARAGDLLVLPVHELDARARVVALLDQMAQADWRPGQPVPAPPPADADENL